MKKNLKLRLGKDGVPKSLTVFFGNDVVTERVDFKLEDDTWVQVGRNVRRKEKLRKTKPSSNK